ncbi:MAG TPA: hypothetical protein VFX95_03565 [Caulobacteraceae bacterium]|nr:hypothetical protein [Caulobacteraceae bacterium]
MTATIPAAAYETPKADVLIALGVTFLLTLQLVNLATFNFQPDRMRLAIDALSLMGYGGLFVLTLLYASSSTIVHLLGFMLLAGAGVIGLVRNPEAASITELVKALTGPMVLGLLTARWKPPPFSAGLWLLWFVAIGAVLLASFLAFTGPPYMNGPSQRLAVFAGGETGLHPSAYAMACFALLLLVLLRHRVGLSLVTVAILAVAAAAIVGYGVRTVWLMLIVFAFVLTFQWLWKRSAWSMVAGVGVTLIAVAAGLAVLMNMDFDLLRFSSGRSVIYLERLGVIGSRDLGDLLFGTGAGTDAMRGVGAWRWTEKDSHNDFMAVLTESGVIGLIGFLLVIGAALWGSPRGYRGWVLMMIASAAVSNGVLLRPSIGPPLILVAFVAMSLRQKYAPAPDPWLEASPDGQRFAHAAE